MKNIDFIYWDHRIKTNKSIVKILNKNRAAVFMPNSIRHSKFEKYPSKEFLVNKIVRSA